MTDEALKEVIARAEDEYEMLKDRVHDLYDENIELKNKINKAIKHIENCHGMYRNTIGDIQPMINIKPVLDILKGVDKE